MPKINKQWLEKNLKDPYIKRSKQDCYRSRAAYKLIELNDKHHLIKKNYNILDLGAAPGSWSQVAVKIPNTKVIAVDILKMEEIKNVHFIQGDITENRTIEQILNTISQKKFNFIMSDMAVNLTGNTIVDQVNMINIMNAVNNSLNVLLLKEGTLLVKLFNGPMIEKVKNLFKNKFKKLIISKPAASRKNSKEVYLIAIGFNN